METGKGMWGGGQGERTERKGCRNRAEERTVGKLMQGAG